MVGEPPRIGSILREFEALFPSVQIDRDVLYVDNGDVLTSAGMCCGIDMCLYDGDAGSWCRDRESGSSARRLPHLIATGTGTGMFPRR